MCESDQEIEEWSTEPCLNICIIFGNVRTQTQLAWIVSLAGAATSIIFVTCLLLWQKYACHDTISVATKLFCRNFFFFFLVNKRVCCDKSMLIVSKLLLWQNYVCCNKYLSQTTCLLWQTDFRRDKHIFVITKNSLSWQTCVCCGKHMFVTTKLLSWKKLYLWQLPPIIGWMCDWTNGLINQFLCLYAFSALAHLPTAMCQVQSSAVCADGAQCACGKSHGDCWQSVWQVLQRPWAGGTTTQEKFTWPQQSTAGRTVLWVQLTVVVITVKVC